MSQNQKEKKSMSNPFIRISNINDFYNLIRLCNDKYTLYGLILKKEKQIQNKTQMCSKKKA